jgi:Zn-finger nucleic acid-binding protein
MMTENPMATRGTSDSGQVEIWYCTGCKAVHMGVGEMRVSFDRQRFSEFATMVAEIHYENLAGSGTFDILNIAKEIDVESSRGN